MLTGNFLANWFPERPLYLCHLSSERTDMSMPDPRLSPTDLLVQLANDITDESERWARDALIALIATTLHTHLHSIVECAVDYFLDDLGPTARYDTPRTTLCAQIEARCLGVIERTRAERLAKEEAEETDHTNNHDVA